jgi:hypothetical protein
MCAAMDAQVDVAVHTLVQLAPPSLYYHVRVVELLLWEPWAAPSDAQFAMLLMVRCRLLDASQLHSDIVGCHLRDRAFAHNCSIHAV